MEKFNAPEAHRRTKLGQLSSARQSSTSLFSCAQANQPDSINAARGAELLRDFLVRRMAKHTQICHVALCIDVVTGRTASRAHTFYTCIVQDSALLAEDEKWIERVG